MVYTGGKIYSAQAGLPEPDVLAVRGGRIVYVGNSAGAQSLPGPVRSVDLKGATILPGLIDTHAHPGLVSILGSGDPEADETMGLDTSTKEAFYTSLRRTASASPGKDLLVLGAWDVASFLPDGPHKRDLDMIFPDRPVIIFDNSGHSIWTNSAGLKLLGIDRNTPDLAANISIVARDATGEPTGWLKEFISVGPMMPSLVPDDAELKSRLEGFLAFLSRRGVTTLYDAGNLGVEDRVYKMLAELDAEGKLPLRYFGTYHIWAPSQIETAADELLRLRRQYGSERLIFDTIKIHYDGVTEIHTAGMLQDYANRPSNRGGVLFERDRLAQFLVELDRKRINLHLHTVGDRAARTAIDAVEKARLTLGRPLAIKVSLAHLELLDPADFARFKALDVSANYTPHWFGNTSFGRAGYINLGKERADQRELAGTMMRSGANVTLSSDVISSDEMLEADPFLGIEMAVTRHPPSGRPDPDRIALPGERLTLDEALRAYTINGAYALGIDKEAGSLSVGKSADFIIIRQNLFAMPASDIHRTEVEAVYLGGKLVSGTAR